MTVTYEYTGQVAPRHRVPQTAQRSVKPPSDEEPDLRRQSGREFWSGSRSARSH